MGRETLESCFTQHFEDHGDLTSDTAQEHLLLFKEYVLGMTFEQDFEMEVVKVYQRGGTLHQRCTILKPVSLQQWSAMKEPLQQLDIFRHDLKTDKQDDSVLATRQNNAIKETVGNLKVKL